MKLLQLQEARYAVHPIINTIDEIVKKGKFGIEEFRIDRSDVDWSVEALTKKYGPPDESDSTYDTPTIDWFVDVGGGTLEITVGCSLSGTNFCHITVRYVK